MPMPQISEVMVYDITARKLYSWRNRAWLKPPVVTRYSKFNIAAKTTNPGTVTVTLGFMLYEGSKPIAQQTGEVQPNKPFDFVTETEMQDSSRNFTLKLLLASPPPMVYTGIADTMSFTVEPAEQKKEEPPEEPSTPSAGQMCMATALCVPNGALRWARDNIRPKLPMWFVVNYYKLGFWMLNEG